MGGWEHECCGPEIERYQRVQWSCLVHTDGRLYETHHDLDGLSITEVTGVVIDVELVRADDSRVRITRIPSGSALRGFDDRADSAVIEMNTDEVLDASTGEFVVTLDTPS